jgi:hypothetical protein
MHLLGLPNALDVFPHLPQTRVVMLVTLLSSFAGMLMLNTALSRRFLLLGKA